MVNDDGSDLRSWLDFDSAHETSDASPAARAGVPRRSSSSLNFHRGLLRRCGKSRAAGLLQGVQRRGDFVPGHASFCILHPVGEVGRDRVGNRGGLPAQIVHVQQCTEINRVVCVWWVYLAVARPGSPHRSASDAGLTARVRVPMFGPRRARGRR